MGISETQIPDRYADVIDEEAEKYKKKISIQDRNKVPDTTKIPIENPSHWLKIPEVVCVFVDMKGSTMLSAESTQWTVASAYRLFTGTAVRLFSEFESPYIDVRGDGVFALFDQGQTYRAFAAAVTFKTFAKEIFTPAIRKKSDGDIEIGAHIGIDQKTVLVRKIGFKRHRGRTDRQNEVWAGRPINMAAKLASIGESNELHASERYFDRIDHDLVRLSCGCPSGEHKPLWKSVDVSDDNKFDFENAYLLESVWCGTHGEEYCDAIMELD